MPEKGIAIHQAIESKGYAHMAIGWSIIPSKALSFKSKNIRNLFLGQRQDQVLTRNNNNVKSNYHWYILSPNYEYAFSLRFTNFSFGGHWSNSHLVPRCSILYLLVKFAYSCCRCWYPDPGCCLCWNRCELESCCLFAVSVALYRCICSPVYSCRFFF